MRWRTRRAQLSLKPLYRCKLLQEILFPALSSRHHAIFIGYGERVAVTGFLLSHSPPVFNLTKMATPSYLVFGGKTGWIGQKVLVMLHEKGIKVKAADSRLENVEQVAAEIDAFKPTHVLNCAGLTGRPNVDWCEDHKDEVIRVNVIGTLGLLDACEARGIHCTNFATG